jgi:acyl-CoA reductase-like NAD-dependent aldehyde dehydrogenase
MTLQDLSARVSSVLPRERGHFWGGEWHVPAGVAAMQSFKPPTGEFLGEIHIARAQDVDAAVSKVGRAFPGWTATPPLDRRLCLREAAVNSVEFGLTASIWTQDLIAAHQTARAVQSGYVWVNDESTHFAGAPFGGYKQSDFGREESKDELFEFTQIKNVNVSVAF